MRAYYLVMMRPNDAAEQWIRMMPSAEQSDDARHQMSDDATTESDYESCVPWNPDKDDV